MSTIGKCRVHNTKDIITPEFKVCAMVYAPSGYGKTTFGATLDRMTKRFMGKPTLFIALEASEGGGTMSIQQFGVDYVVPQNIEEFTGLVTALGSDTTYGGVVLDSSAEYVKRFLQPYALGFPAREGIATRAAGVPERSDYQTMGEKARQQLNLLVGLTTEKFPPEVRKHLVVTGLEREKTDKQGNVVAIQPDLPGALAGAATAMFQTVGGIKIGIKVVPEPETKTTKRQTVRTFVTAADGIRNIKDRTNLLPAECEPDWEVIWEKYVIPKIQTK